MGGRRQSTVKVSSRACNSTVRLIKKPQNCFNSEAFYLMFHAVGYTAFLFIIANSLHVNYLSKFSWIKQCKLGKLRTIIIISLASLSKPKRLTDHR